MNKKELAEIREMAEAMLPTFSGQANRIVYEDYIPALCDFGDEAIDIICDLLNGDILTSINRAERFLLEWEETAGSREGGSDE